MPIICDYMKNQLEQTEEYKEIAAEAGRIYSSMTSERDELMESIQKDFWPVIGKASEGEPAKTQPRKAKKQLSKTEAKEEAVIT